MLKFFKYFLKFFKKINKKYKLYYLFYVLISIIINFSFFYLVLLYGKIVNFITENDLIKGSELKDLKYFVLIYVLVTILSYTLIKLFSTLNIYFSENIKLNLQKTLFKSIIENNIVNNGLKDNNNKDSGYYVQIFTKDLEYIAQLFLDFLFTLPSEFILIIYILFFILKLNILIFSISLVLILAGILLVKRREKVVFYYSEFDKAYKSFYSNYNKNIKGLETLKIYSKTEYIKKFSLNYLKLVLQKYKIYIKHNFIYDFLIKFINEIYYATIFTICFFLLFKRDITPGIYVLLITITGVIKQKIDYFIQNLNYLQNFIPYLKRVDDFIDVSPKKQNSFLKNFHVICNSLNKDNVNRNLIFKAENLSLYIKDKIIFSNLNFTINEKDKVWIKGKSGSGKSTLIKLLFFYEYLSNIDDYKVDGKLEIYKNLKIGILFQEPYIFNRSIKELFICINQNIDENEIAKYLEMVKLDYCFKKLKNGFNTKIGQQSKFISSGEKKRLQLARLFAYNPDILILDEPFVNLDKENIEIILDILNDIFKEKTIIINSHNDIVKDIVNNIIYIN